MKDTILVAISDSVSSRNMLNYLVNHPFMGKDAHITLLHVFRKPETSDELMGKKFMEEQPARFRKVMEDAKAMLVEHGYAADRIDVNLVTEPYPTVTDGIIDQFDKGSYSMVVLGRRRMSKAEEFVLGDVGVKLVRALDKVAILVVKT